MQRSRGMCVGFGYCSAPLSSRRCQELRFPAEILSALASDWYVSGTSTEERMAVELHNDSEKMKDCATDAEVWERCRACVKLAVSMDKAGAPVLVVQRDSAIALKLKVLRPS